MNLFTQEAHGFLERIHILVELVGNMVGVERSEILHENSFLALAAQNLQALSALSTEFKLFFKTKHSSLKQL